MKLTIQRQCDGNPITHADCATRLHIDTTVEDTRGDLEKFNAAWVAVAITLGWRRYGAIGVPHLMPIVPSDPDTIAVVPATRTWLLCPECIRTVGFPVACARCTNQECSCMGGPQFDITIDVVDQDGGL